MADVFVSYATEDHLHAQHLAAWLEARGYSVSWDVTHGTGDEYASRLAQELVAARIVLLLWSPHSVGSREVLGWALMALRDGKLLQIRVNAREELSMPASFAGHAVLDLSQTEQIAATIAGYLREPDAPPDDEPITEVRAPPRGDEPGGAERSQALGEAGQSDAVRPTGVAGMAVPASREPLSDPATRPRRNTTAIGGRRPSAISANRIGAGRRVDAISGELIKRAVLVENIPRQMMANEAVTVEARIAAEDHMAVLEGLLGEVQKHGIVATPAMTVQLQAPKGGFAIEALSRETQWIDGSHNQQLGPLQSPSFGQWQWRVKPTQRGHGELVLVVAARTADRDGVVADSPLPEQRIPVRVTVNYLHATTSVLKWVAVAAMGGIVVGFGPQALKMIAKVIG